MEESKPTDKQYDVFISYAREDEHAVARPLADTFRARGFEVWLDRLVLNAGSKIEDGILSGLQNCYCPVVIVSKDFLRKEWPKKELDILLALEEVDDRYRIVTVRHEVSEIDLRTMSQYLAQRTVISTEAGIETVCDRIIKVATNYAAVGVRHSVGTDSSVPLAQFFAPGAVKCENPDCTWKSPLEGMGFSDIGPEFTLTRENAAWYVACASCNTLAAGPLDKEQARWILAFVRMHIFAPERAPYLKGND